MTSAPRRAGVLLTLILAGLSMFGPFNVDAPLPAFGEMGAEFHVEPAAMQLVVSVYLLAFALMSLLHGPISDAVGRRPVMLIGIGVYVVASIGCALSTSLTMLLVFRMFQGFAAGAGQIIARTVIRDLFEGAEAQRLMSQVSMIFGVAPAVAPVLSGLLLQVGSWRTIFWFLVAFGIIMAVSVALSLPESLPAEHRTPLRVGSLVSGLLAAMRSGRFMRVAFAAAFSFAGQFLYISAAPLFLIGLLGLGESDFWVFFVPMVACMITGSWTSGRLAGRVTSDRQITYGLGFALLAASAGAIVSVTPVGDVLPWAIVAPALIAYGIGLSLPTLQIAMLDQFPHARGSAASAGTFVNLVTSALVAGLVAPFAAENAWTMAVTALGLVMLGAAMWLWHLVSTRPVNALRQSVRRTVPGSSRRS